jgi:hypothetical protein
MAELPEARASRGEGKQIALLGETFRLLGRHLDLFTLIVLTVWFPAHLAANYLQFFGAGAEPQRALSLVLMIELVFGPLVAGATITTLARIKQGMPTGYWVALGEGFNAWGRLLVVRVITGVLIALGLLALVVPGLLLLVRYALVDSVAVLEGALAGEARQRSTALTAGLRWAIFWTGGLLFAGVVSLGILLSLLLDAIPPFNHFVIRVLVDSMLSVTQCVFTIALFLFYWRARMSVTGRPDS